MFGGGGEGRGGEGRGGNMGKIPSAPAKKTTAAVTNIEVTCKL